MGWSQDLFRYLWRSLSKEVKEHVGTDQFGNKYYYIAGYKNWRGQTIREKRIVEAVKKQEVDYESGDIPTEWEGHRSSSPRTFKSSCVMLGFPFHPWSTWTLQSLETGMTLSPKQQRWLRTSPSRSSVSLGLEEKERLHLLWRKY
ncbi:NADH dehydrogenase [ubiquinone] 1 alpha subcomplex assembly factor 2 isoform X7 [Saimiri boliviensis]|uniref:NADH dehydrogenase [ubiquinone] 1 alpha subcomplex assembly factor 2 isoform X7 n=1 Tax=Saimiri boliviensis TaxID=27679 RepID=UPI003D786F57